MIYLNTNVFEEALNRIRFVYDNFEDVIVSMSGGKDSTVLFHLALIVAEERNRLPLKVFWLDQEAEWQGTVDYMTKIMSRPDVDPYWFQIPFDFTNSLSPNDNYLSVFDENERDKWIHEKSDISIKENPSEYTRFHDLVVQLPRFISDKECAVLVGMRIAESPARRMAITNAQNGWRGITWCTKPIGNTRKMWPIYDFTNDDVWAAIANNHWEYNKVYDYMYKWGTAKKDMRVSALIHETAWHSIEMLQEFEPKTYNRFVRRIAGTSTFNHAFEQGIVPRELPFAFESWKEYRDYLLIHITKPEYWKLFQRRWAKQEGDTWYKIHVKEVILNDIDGTMNKNAYYTESTKKRIGDGSKYDKRRREQFETYMREKANND